MSDTIEPIQVPLLCPECGEIIGSAHGGPSDVETGIYANDPCDECCEAAL